MPAAADSGGDSEGDFEGTKGPTTHRANSGAGKGAPALCLAGRQAGAHSWPHTLTTGTAVETFHDRLRRELCPGRARAGEPRRVDGTGHWRGRTGATGALWESEPGGSEESRQAQLCQHQLKQLRPRCVARGGVTRLCSDGTPFAAGNLLDTVVDSELSTM